LGTLTFFSLISRLTGNRRLGLIVFWVFLVLYAGLQLSTYDARCNIFILVLDAIYKFLSLLFVRVYSIFMAD